MSSDSSKPKRKKWDAADKARILAEYEAAPSALARAELMRREAVYASLIASWRKQLTPLARPRRRSADPQAKHVEQLEKEIIRLRKRAERAEDLVETLGKVHALLQNAANKSAKDMQQ